MTVRGRKPTLRVVRDGEAQPPAPRSRTPAPPAHLSADAKAEWRRHAADLNDAGLLTRRDRSAFEMVCESYARWIEANRQIAALTSYTVTKASGNVTAHALIHVARGALADYARMAEHFGLTPLSRGRVKGTPKRKGTNPYLDT